MRITLDDIPSFDYRSIASAPVCVDGTRLSSSTSLSLVLSNRVRANVGRAPEKWIARSFFRLEIKLPHHESTTFGARFRPSLKGRHRFQAAHSPVNRMTRSIQTRIFRRFTR